MSEKERKKNVRCDEERDRKRSFIVLYAGLASLSYETKYFPVLGRRKELYRGAKLNLKQM